MRVIVSIAIVFCLARTAFAADVKPLNYVIVLADDMGTVGMGCYGSPNPTATPNIDRLATEALLFTNMFVAASTCSPVRAELYTGLFPEKNGVNRNHHPAKPETRSVAHYLKKLGYRVGIAGKTHISPAPVYPFERIKGIEGQATASKVGPDDRTETKAFIGRDR